MLEAEASRQSPPWLRRRPETGVTAAADGWRTAGRCGWISDGGDL